MSLQVIFLSTHEQSTGQTVCPPSALDLLLDLLGLVLGLGVVVVVVADVVVVVVVLGVVVVVGTSEGLGSVVGSGLLEGWSSCAITAPIATVKANARQLRWILFIWDCDQGDLE